MYEKSSTFNSLSGFVKEMMAWYGKGILRPVSKRRVRPHKRTSGSPQRGPGQITPLQEKQYRADVDLIAANSVGCCTVTCDRPVVVIVLRCCRTALRGRDHCLIIVFASALPPRGELSSHVYIQSFFLASSHVPYSFHTPPPVTSRCSREQQAGSCPLLLQPSTA